MRTGKHSTKKDSYFQTLMAVPPKQRLHIQPIDARTLRDGFSVSLTGLPSYNKASLEGTDPKEKEAKRLKVGLRVVHVLFVPNCLDEHRRNDGKPRRRRGYDCNSSSQAPVPRHLVPHQRHVLWPRLAHLGLLSAMLQSTHRPRLKHLSMPDRHHPVLIHQRYLVLSHNSGLRRRRLLRISLWQHPP
jgi:hypothetical protein